MSILKAMAGVTAGFSLLVFFVLLRDGFMEALVILGKFLLFGLAGTLLLFGISYAIFALMNSGRYYVLFEMDGTGVNHIQIGKQVKKAKALGLLTSLAGVSARRNLPRTTSASIKPSRSRTKNTSRLNPAVTPAMALSILLSLIHI